MKKLIILIAALYILAATNNSAIAQGWKLTGNTGTNPNTNFIGTKDNVNFNIRTNNIVQMTVASDGKVGIGTTLPDYALDINGGSINTSLDYRIAGITVLSISGSNNLFA